METALTHRLSEEEVESIRLVAVNWMLTYRCTGQCRYCLTDSRPDRGSGEMTVEQKVRAVEILASQGIRRISIMGGEPFCVEELQAVIDCAHLHAIIANVTTSGRGVTRDRLVPIRGKLQYLNVSLDGPAEYNDCWRGKGSYAAAVTAIEAARHLDIAVRLYATLTRRNSDESAIRWLFEVAREYSAGLIMFIFLSPLGRGMKWERYRLNAGEIAKVLHRVERASEQFGIRYKRADPFLPEAFKIFLDADGRTYKHHGEGRNEYLGNILERPDQPVWSQLNQAEQRAHWAGFADLHRAPPSARPAEQQAPPNMVYVPPGAFQMGGLSAEREKPIHSVYLDGFYMDTHAVTNSEFAEFLDHEGNESEEGGVRIDLASPFCLIDRTGSTYRAREGFERYPVVMVTWYGAREYARWRGKRLPTEAEWEKAALGGIDGRTYPWGEAPPSIQCNWLGYQGVNGYLRPDFYHGRGPLPVGLFPSNEYGLYDLAGNVWEWCSDWYAPNSYSAGLRINPTGPAQGEKKVLRGGSWSFSASNLRVANRSYAPPDRGYSYDGFRCVLSGIDIVLDRRRA